MRKIEQALVFFFWALLTVSPSGCGDDERPDDSENDDTDDGDGGADAGPDASTDWGSSGVFGHVYCVCGDADVHWTGSGFSAGSYSASTTTGPDDYYEVELPPGLYNGYASSGLGTYEVCEGWVSQVLVSDGLWVEIDIETDYTIYD
jgi:hypothetical protein